MVYFSAVEIDRLAVIIVPRQSAHRCCAIFLPSCSSASAFLSSTTSVVPGTAGLFWSVGMVNFWNEEMVSRGWSWGRHSCFICSSSRKQMDSPQVLPLLHYIILHLRRPCLLWILPVVLFYLQGHFLLAVRLHSCLFNW